MPSGAAQWATTSVKAARLPPQSSSLAGAGGVPVVFAHLTDEHFASDDALREAWEQYGDDADRELADLEAGCHPLQSPRV